MLGVRSTQRHLYGTSAPTRDLAQHVRTGDERDAYDALAGGAALHRTAEGNEVRDAPGDRSYARRAAQEHSWITARDCRRRGPDAPRDRRPDRGTGRAQPHRSAPWP